MLMPCSLRTLAILATPLSDAPLCLAWDPPEVTEHLTLDRVLRGFGESTNDGFCLSGSSFSDFKV